MGDEISDVSWLQQMVPSTIRTPQNQSDSLRTKEDEISELSWLQQMVPSTIRTPQNQSDSLRTKEDEISELSWLQKRSQNRKHVCSPSKSKIWSTIQNAL